MLYNTYGLEPEEATAMMTIIAIPWVPKMFYGIFTDTFPLCGSTKKNYLILLGTIMCIAAGMIGIYEFKSHWPVVILATISMTCSAMMDVVVDGLMVT